MFVLSLVIFGLSGVFLGVDGTCEQCDPDGMITLEMVLDASADILTDPVSVMQNYKQLACPGPCTDLTRLLVVEQRIFNLTLIDLQILLLEAKQHFDAIYLAFAKNNPSPYLDVTATIFLDGVLIGASEINALLCQANKTIGYALGMEVPQLRMNLIEANANMDALAKCARKHNMHVGDAYPTQMRNCIRKVLNQLSVDFTETTTTIGMLKDLSDTTALNKANCLLRQECNQKLDVALDIAKCIGYWEDHRLDQLFQIISECSKLIDNLGTKISTAAINTQKCGVHYVEKYYEDLIDANIVC